MEEAKEWWKGLSFEEKFYKTIEWLKIKRLDTTSKHPDRLTDSEIEEIFKGKN